MTTTYIPNEPVSCVNCGAQFHRRGPRSKSGYYYCSKTPCQSARARAWREEQKVAHGQKTIAERDRGYYNSAVFLGAVLRAPRVQCPECGLVNGLVGYPHFGRDGGPCTALAAGRVEGVTKAHAEAAWPEDEREYRDPA